MENKKDFKNHERNYEVVSNIFENMLFDVGSSPIKLHGMFNNIKHVELDIIQSIYFIKFRGIFIANIHQYQLELTPGIFINHEVHVFKTYNKLLRMFVKNRFVKFINNKWILCKEVK